MGNQLQTVIEILCHRLRRWPNGSCLLGHVPLGGSVVVGPTALLAGVVGIPLPECQSQTTPQVPVVLQCSGEAHCLITWVLPSPSQLM